MSNENKVVKGTKYRGYKVTSPYGNRIHPITKEKEFHKGIDLVLKDKAPIKAFVGGKVIHAKEGVKGSGLGNYGNVVVIDTGSHLNIYAHLDTITCEVGELLKAGEYVGTQGNTGASAGSHLHFEVRKEGEKFGYGNHVEPVEWLDNAIVVKPKPKAKVEPVYYMVRPHDTLSKIAQLFKTTVKHLDEINTGITNPDDIRVGQLIRIK